MKFLPAGTDPEDVVVLSIREPWASVTASGHRTVDSRPSSTAHRGPVVLHAANRVEGAPNGSPRWAELLQAALADGHARPYRTLGRTLGLANLVDVHHSTTCRGRCSPWAVNRLFHWVFEDATYRVGPTLIGRPRLALAPADVVEFYSRPEAVPA